jgi:hypothetical protein
VSILRFFAKEGPVDQSMAGFQEKHRNVSLEREPPRSETAAAAVPTNWCAAVDALPEDSPER